MACITIYVAVHKNQWNLNRIFVLTPAPTWYNNENLTEVVVVGRIVENLDVQGTIVHIKSRFVYGF